MEKYLIRKFHKSMAGSRGYTLMELLAVIAILAVLLGIAVPSVVSVSGALKFAQRNDHARRIFLAAQANLTRLRAEGRLICLREEAENAFPVPENSCGFPAEDWSGEYVYTASSLSADRQERDAYALVLPGESLDADLRQRQVIIEYNPVTGNIYAVFYCREELVGKTGKSLLELYRSGTLPREDTQKRRELMVGYCGGAGLSSSPLETARSRARMTFENGEEGILTILIPMPESYVGAHFEFMQGLEITLTVTGETGGGVLRDIPVKQPGTVDEHCKLDTDGKTVRVTYVLDSLYRGKGFAHLSADSHCDGEMAEAAGFGILPGENVSLNAKITFHPAANRPDVQVRGANLAGVNPMFGYLTRNLFREGYSLTIANGRNLQNLNAIAPSVAAGITDVIITEDIYWNRTADYYNSRYGGGGTYSSPAEESPARALPFFVPICNEMLVGTAEFCYLDGSGERETLLEELLKDIVGDDFENNPRVPTLTDQLDTQPHARIRGEGHRVYNLRIDAGSRQGTDCQFTGLFGYLNTEVSDLHLVNPVIRGLEFDENASNPATGALAGACGYRSRIRNCSVYLDPDAEGFREESGVSGAGAVGGLVGYAKSLGTEVSFLRCFAAVPVSGSLRGHDLEKDYGYSNGVGGLVGNAQLVRFQHCYASGSVRVENTYCPGASYGAESLQTVLGLCGEGRRSMGGGGFVGTSHGARFTDCFASGDVTRVSGSGDMAGAGGFVGMMCYDGTRVFGHRGDKTPVHTVFENCYAVGLCLDSSGVRLESFAGGTGTMGIQYGPTASYYSPDYYRLLAPYRLWQDADPWDQAYYVFRDSYYLSRYGDGGQDQSRKCANPLGYSELMNLHWNYDNGDWIRDRIHRLKTDPLDAQAAAAALDFGLELVQGLSDEAAYAQYLTFRENLEKSHPQYWHQLYWNIVGFLEDKGLRSGAAILEERYFAHYAAGFSAQNWETAIEENTHGYGNAGAAGYPFPKLSGMDYYGSWPQEPLTAGLAYYEIYDTAEGSAVGYCFDPADTAALRNHGDIRILHDGYGVFSGSGQDIIRIYDEAGNLIADSLRPEPNSVTLPGDGSAYYVTKLPDSVLEQLIPGGDGYYSAIRIQISNSSGIVNHWALLNPNTAISQVNTVAFGDDGKLRYPENPETILIRTARQLMGLGSGKMRSLWGDEGLIFLQQLHIDASVYDWNNDGAAAEEDIPTLSPIGDGVQPFLAAYTGTGGYVSRAQIRGFRQEAPLFGTIGASGRIRGLDIRVEGDPVIGSGESDYTALVAGVCAGRMEDVQLHQTGTVTLRAKTAAGLLVGCLTGTGEKRAILRGCDITAETANIMAEYAGGVLGTAQNADLENLTTRFEKITAKTARAGGLAGGLDDVRAQNLTVAICGGLTCDVAAGLAARIESGDFSDITVKLEGEITAATQAAGFAVTLGGTVENALVVTQTRAVINGTEEAAGFAIRIAGTDTEIRESGVTPAPENTAEGYLGRSNGDLTVTGNTAALFALEISEGSLVADCYALGTVLGAQASGFADVNSGTVDGAAVNVTITGGYAFVRENIGTISNSYGWYGHGGETPETEEISTLAVMDGRVVSSYFADLGSPVTEDRHSAHIYDWDGRYRTGSLLSLTLQELNGETGGRWFPPGSFDAFPYDRTDRVSYPYPMIRVHFGPWGQ